MKNFDGLIQVSIPDFYVERIRDTQSCGGR